MPSAEGGGGEQGSRHSRPVLSDSQRAADKRHSRGSVGTVCCRQRRQSSVLFPERVRAACLEEVPSELLLSR